MIHQIIISNYKSIRNLTLPLSRLNVLIGTNGAGKSNFISFFKLINAIYNRRLGVYTLEQGGINNLLYRGSKHSGEFSGLINFNHTNAFFFTIKPTSSGKGFIEQSGNYFNANQNADDNYGLWEKIVWDEAVEESEIKNNSSWGTESLKKSLRSFIVYHFHDTSSTSVLKRPCNISDTEFLRYDGSNLAAFLYYISVKHPKHFRKIEGIIRSVAPYFDAFDLKPNAYNEQTILLEWREKDSDMYLNGHNLSDGTLRFIALTTLLMQPEPPELILIDEPELGLHPAAINKLASMLRVVSGKSQIIVSTQSPGLLDTFNPEEIIAVDRKDSQSVFQRLDGEELQNRPEDYSIGDLFLTLQQRRVY